MSCVAEDTVFKKAVDRFRAGLTKEQREGFAGCDRREVEKTIAYIQDKYGSQKRQRNMRRVSKFIEGMSQLGQVVEVFLNVEVSVAFIWGPMKFLLQTASTWVATLDLLLDTYAEIGETLPGLSRYGELFKHHPPVGQQLENYYCDVLEFNKCALEVFSRPGWKTIFHSAWKTFKTNFGPILSSFRRHKTLLSEEKLTALMSEVQSNFQQLRNNISSRDAQDQARILAEVEQRRRHQRRALREDLDAPDSHQDQEHSFAVLQGSSSGDWIASESTLKAWSDPLSTQSSFLFLSGIPGAGQITPKSYWKDVPNETPGKTTLTSGIVNHLLQVQKRAESYGSKILVAYFYFKHTHEDKRTLHKMMRSVLSQLIDQDPSLLDHAHKAVCGASIISFDQVKELTQLAIRSSRLCFLVVDGLDECVKDETSRISETEKVIKWLMELTTPSPGAQSSDIRILVSSQRDGVIEEKLKDYPTLQLETLQLHDNDIERYVRMQARVISETFPDSNATDEERIVEKITTAAKGMFLYAKVVLDNLLEQETAFDFEAELEDKNFPKGLEEAYDRIVCRVLKASKETKRRFAQKILGFVICAHRPLWWREIQSLFCIDPETGTADMSRRPIRSCKHFCSSLIDVTGYNGNTNDPEGRVELVHGSAKRYLINTEAICLATEHARMALFTSRYLASKPFDLKATEDIQNFALSGYYNIHDYAVTSWWHHTHEAILHSSSLSEDLFLELIYSLFAHLQFHLGVQTDEFPDPPTPGAIVAKFRQLPTDDRSREDFGNLSARIRAIRDVVETIWALIQHDFKIESSIGLRLYGPRQYKCFNSWCHRFSDGFHDSKQRDAHMNQHVRPFRCSVDGCFAGVLGLPSEQQLQQHVSRHHQEPEGLKFPNARAPKKPQTMAAAIRAGDLEAVKAVVQRSVEKRGVFEFQKPNVQHRGRVDTALNLAVESKSFTICQYLLEKGAPPQSRQLRLAIAQNDADMFGLLISYISPAQFAVMDPGSLFSHDSGLADADIQRTFVNTVESHHPCLRFSDLIVQEAIKQGLVEIVKFCLTRENDMLKQRLEADYMTWMNLIMQTSQECLQVLLSCDESGVVMNLIFFEARHRQVKTVLSWLPRFTPNHSICERYWESSSTSSWKYPSEVSEQMRLILKSDEDDKWKPLGMEIQFLPLDIRLKEMNSDLLREALSADDSLFFCQDATGATLLHGFVHSRDVGMVEFSTSIEGLDLNSHCDWRGNGSYMSPIGWALRQMGSGVGSLDDQWARIVYHLLSTGRIDISELTAEDELPLSVAAGKADGPNDSRSVFELGLLHLCPLATTEKIRSLIQELPFQADRLALVLRSAPDAVIQKKDFELANLVANPYVYSQFDTSIKKQDFAAARKLFSPKYERYPFTGAERAAFIDFTIKDDDATTMMKLVIDDESTETAAFFIAVRGKLRLLEALQARQGVKSDRFNDVELTPLQVAKSHNNEGTTESLWSP